MDKPILDALAKMDEAGVGEFARQLYTMVQGGKDADIAELVSFFKTIGEKIDRGVDYQEEMARMMQIMMEKESPEMPQFPGSMAINNIGEFATALNKSLVVLFEAIREENQKTREILQRMIIAYSDKNTNETPRFVTLVDGAGRIVDLNLPAPSQTPENNKNVPAVSIPRRVIHSTDRPFRTIVSATKTISMTDVAEVLGSAAASDVISVSADIENTNTVYIGGADVSSTLKKGTPLIQGSSFSFKVDNLAKLYVAGPAGAVLSITIYKY